MIAKKMLLSLMSLLAMCVAVDGQTDRLAVPTHSLNVGEYRPFGPLSLLRLYTAPIFDPEEARSAEVRCFHRLKLMTTAQRRRAFDEIRSGNMQIASNVDEMYYAVNPIAIANSLTPTSAGLAMTSMGLFPHNSWRAHSDQLESVVDSAGIVAASPYGDSLDYWTELGAIPGDELGVVARREVSVDLPSCERIVNWTGVAEHIGYAGVSAEDVSEDEETIPQ